jgi:deoxyribose-phosphate aldolase
MNIAKYIDHTLLKTDATEAQHAILCEEAANYHFATVCVRPEWVKYCRKKLSTTPVKTITVISFPHGTDPTEKKVADTKKAIKDGAQEIDMVIDVPALKARKLRAIYKDIRKVVQAAGKTPVKVIIETCLLTTEEKIIASALAKAAQAAFVKTSTGFSTGGATAEDIALMRATVGPKMGVKASGGIRTFSDAKKMIDAGATRIGASASVEIVKGALKPEAKENAAIAHGAATSAKKGLY